MIIYEYDEKSKTLRIEIRFTIEGVPQKPSEEDLREMIPVIFEYFGDKVKNGKVKIVEKEKLGVW